jgi:hypothetical protein
LQTVTRKFAGDVFGGEIRAFAAGASSFQFVGSEIVDARRRSTLGVEAGCCANTALNANATTSEIFIALRNMNASQLLCGFAFAASPPSVRKGSAFPSIIIKSLARLRLAVAGGTPAVPGFTQSNRR